MKNLTRSLHVVREVQDQSQVDKLKTIPLENDIISRWIEEMSDNIKRGLHLHEISKMLSKW